jgi:hypothetical protein
MENYKNIDDKIVYILILGFAVYFLLFFNKRNICAECIVVDKMMHLSACTILFLGYKGLLKINMKEKYRKRFMIIFPFIFLIIHFSLHVYFQSRMILKPY